MTAETHLAEKWDGLASRFTRLANDPEGHKLCAEVVRGNAQVTDVATWFVHGSRSDLLREDFKVCASEAADALGTSIKGHSPLDLWLHRLYQYLCEEASPSKYSSVISAVRECGSMESAETPGIVEVCGPSAAFCRSLQLQARNDEQVHESTVTNFQRWVVENAPAPEALNWFPPYSLRGWLSFVARTARVSIPIDFLSDRLSFYRLPSLPSEFRSLREFLNDAAEREGLIWCITNRGLWMARHLPADSVYFDSDGKEQCDSVRRIENYSGFTIDARVEDYQIEPLALAVVQGPLIEFTDVSQSLTAGEYFDKSEVLGEPSGMPRAYTFRPSDDYRIIECGGRRYQLTELAAKIVKALHDAHIKNGNPLSAGQIRRLTKCANVWDAFKKRDGRAFYKEIIKKPSKDMFGLAID